MVEESCYAIKSTSRYVVRDISYHHSAIRGADGRVSHREYLKSGRIESFVKGECKALGLSKEDLTMQG